MQQNAMLLPWASARISNPFVSIVRKPVIFMDSFSMAQSLVPEPQRPDAQGDANHAVEAENSPVSYRMVGGHVAQCLGSSVR
jgi:hypothetical protein